MRKQVTYAGNHPDKEKGWVQWGEVESDGEQWVLYFQPQQKSADWVTIKVCAKTRALSKGNYWLARNLKTKQMAFKKDLEIMDSSRPGLRQKIDEIMQNDF